MQMEGIDPAAALTLEWCNQNTLFFRDEERDRLVFVFNYASTNVASALSWMSIKDLKHAKKWNVAKHPFVLNYIDNVLLRCAGTYTAHAFGFFTFLMALYTFVLTEINVWSNTVVTVLIALFVLSLVIKLILKVRREHTICLSIPFYASFVLALTTYVLTLMYAWLPVFVRVENYDRTVFWMLAMVAIMTSWVQCLLVLRKSPCGLYVMMMTKILKSFAHTTIIWVPTLICFTFSFQLVMQNSGQAPWDDMDPSNSSAVSFFTMLQAITKTSAMMIGDLATNDILNRHEWLANLIFVVFEIVNVILLMNLMVSIAVGDVSELRTSAEDRILRIKINYVIEMLHYLEVFYDFSPEQACIHNAIVISRRDKKAFSATCSLAWETLASVPPNEKAYHLTLTADEMRCNFEDSSDLAKLVKLGNIDVQLSEVVGNGMHVVTCPELLETLCSLKNRESCYKKYARWLIGVDWRGMFAPKGQTVTYLSSAAARGFRVLHSTNGR